MIGWIAAELLGFKEYIPPYSTAKGKQILKGVNYASGAAGIRSETGQHLVCSSYSTFPFFVCHIHMYVQFIFGLRAKDKKALKNLKCNE